MVTESKVHTALYLSFAHICFLVGYAYRKCDMNGTWLLLENRTWVNYSECLWFLTPGKEIGKVQLIFDVLIGILKDTKSSVL